MKRKITVFNAETSLHELLMELIINFSYGFVANSITVFMQKELDLPVLINFLIYYTFVSIIISRDKYETAFGKFVYMPVGCTLGAFTGYKLALLISKFI